MSPFYTWGQSADGTGLDIFGPDGNYLSTVSGPRASLLYEDIDEAMRGTHPHSAHYPSPGQHVSDLLEGLSVGFDDDEEGSFFDAMPEDATHEMTFTDPRVASQIGAAFGGQAREPVGMTPQQRNDFYHPKESAQDAVLYGQYQEVDDADSDDDQPLHRMSPDQAPSYDPTEEIDDRIGSALSPRG
jgi:hypothetical protein